jgi:hypothetical protein
MLSPAAPGASAKVLWSRQASIELAGLLGFVVGLGGILFGNAPLALAGFGVLVLAETDVAVQWALVTVPVGMALILTAVGVYLIR